MSDSPKPNGLTPGKTLLLLAGVGVCIAFALLHRQLDIATLHARAREMNGALVFGLMVVLPLVGFPGTVVQAVAGLRFGFGLGFALVALSVVLQMLAAYAVVSAAPKFFGARLEPLRRRLPQTAHTALTQFTMLLPGVPHWAKYYVLPLVGVPLRTYLLWGGSIHIATSAASVLVGNLGEHFTTGRLVAFIVYVAVTTLACAWAFRRLRAQVAAELPAEAKIPPAG